MKSARKGGIHSHGEPQSGRKEGAEFLAADDESNSSVVKKCNFVKMRH